MNLIVNVSENWAIGKGNELLFHLSGDMKFFKEHTVGKTIVMGRKTLESLPKSAPLPNRENIVLTRNADLKKDGVKVYTDIDKLISDLNGKDDVYVIGGESIYKALLPYCDTAYVTKVRATVDNADAFMPDLDTNADWEIETESETFNEKGYDFKFVTYKRKCYP